MAEPQRWLAEREHHLLGQEHAEGDQQRTVVVLGQGRRTITTANAYQKMVKPANGGLSTWNNFVREYTPDLSRYPCTVRLLVGQWDTLTQAGWRQREAATECSRRKAV
jgi:hypothetical protein